MAETYMRDITGESLYSVKVVYVEQNLFFQRTLKNRFSFIPNGVITVGLCSPREETY